MNSIKLNNIQYKRLLIELKKLKISPEKFPGNTDYELIRYKQNNDLIIVYKNKSIVWKSSSVFDKLINQILETQIDFYKEFDLIIGSDEVGKGEWFGPLITTATCIDKSKLSKLQKLGVKDSKDLKKEKIFSLFKQVNQINLKRKTVIINPPKLKELWRAFIKENKNYNDLIAWEHQRAILDLLSQIDSNKKILIIIDKFDVNKINSRLKEVKKKENITILQISGGESHIPVALASVIAKKIWYEEIADINKKYNLNLLKTKLEEINPEIVFKIGKLFFENVRKVVNEFYLKRSTESLKNLIDLGDLKPENDYHREVLDYIIKSNKALKDFFNKAKKFKSGDIDKSEPTNSKFFLEVLESRERYNKEIEKIQKVDPDFSVKQLIVYQLNQKIDETDIIDFKYCLKPKDKIARTISAFCNRFVLTKEKSFIVFGIKDKKVLPKGFSIQERVLSLNQMLSESKLSNPEEFQFEVNKLVEKHLTPCPDSCFKIKSLNLKGYGPIKMKKEIIIIQINNFNLDQPIMFKKEIFIRKNGQDKKATPEEIVQLTKKIETIHKK